MAKVQWIWHLIGYYSSFISTREVKLLLILRFGVKELNEAIICKIALQ